MFRESETRWVIFVLGIVTLFRLWYCTYNGLVGDEAYYWLWSKHLDASYYSKGPAVAWTIALGTHLFGNTVFGVRCLSVLLSLGTGWQLYLLGRRLYTPRIGLWVVLVAAVTPLFAFGSILMTIDPLSVFFWVWAINLFLDALENPNFLRWAFVGFSVGSGFLAKYTNAMQLLSFLLFFLISSTHRKWLFSWQHLILLLTFAFVISPVLWWNQQHHWITAVHLQQNGHLDEKFRLDLKEFWKFIQGQVLAMSPLIFLSILWATMARWRRDLPWPELLLQTLFWPIFLLYTLLSFHDAANANWTALAYLSGLVLATNFWFKRSAHSATAKGWCRATLAIAFVMTALAHEPFFLNLPARKDPIMRARGWEDWGQQAEVFRQKYQPDFLVANDNGIASELSFYLPGQPQTYIPNVGHIENQFSFWPPYTHHPRQRLLYITDDPINTLPGLLSQEFSHVETVGTFERSFRGRHIENYRVWFLTN